MLTNIFIIKLLSTAWIAILFLQSGFDKVLDYSGNKAWLTDYFSKTFLKSTVGLMIPIITLMEVAAGIISALGIVGLFINMPLIGLCGVTLAALSLLSLFFGARIAKDYATAGSLVPYFILCLIAIYIYSL